MGLESVLHIETKCNDLISIHCLVSVVEFVYPQGTKVIQKRDVIFLFVSLLNPWLTDSPKYQSSVDLIPCWTMDVDILPRQMLVITGGQRRG